MLIFISNVFDFCVQKPPATLPKPAVKLSPLVQPKANSPSSVPSFISNHVISFANQERLRGGVIKVCGLINPKAQVIEYYLLFQDDDFYEHKHNISAKGFNSGQSKVNGNSSHNSPKPAGKLGPALPTKQYNSPKNMYSDNAIQEIMEQQAEVLAGGVKG